MKPTFAVQIIGTGATCFALLGVTTGTAFPQTISSESPTAAVAEAPAPAADCQPIGLTASGEAVFPIHCKDFIERQKNASQKTASESNQKPTVAEKKTDATAQKSGAKQQESAVPETGKLATETVGTVPLPKVRERIVGPPGCTHFHSYDPASGTYKPYDGKRRQCREVISAATASKAGPSALTPVSLKAQPESTGSAAAADNDTTSANITDPRSTVDGDAKKSEGDEAASATIPPVASKASLQSADSVAAADIHATSANVADPRSAADVDTRKTAGADAAPTTTSADRSTVAAAAPPDMKGMSTGNSDPAEMSARGNSEKTGSVSASGTDHLVAVVLARPEITSISGLTGKTIAIDDKYSASNGSVRIAIVAAGASEIELSAGQATALSRLINGEVPAAILALLPADAAEGYPEIAGFKILRIPLSPRS